MFWNGNNYSFNVDNETPSAIKLPNAKYLRDNFFNHPTAEMFFDFQTVDKLYVANLTNLLILLLRFRL